MDALPLDAVHILPVQALFAVFVRVGVVQHMIGAHQLRVVGRIDDPAGMPGFLPPFGDLHDDGGRQLIIEVVQMAHVRLKAVQYLPDFRARFGAVYRSDRIRDFGEHGPFVEVHFACIGVHAVPDRAALAVHAKILDLMAARLQIFADLERIGLRTALGI